MLCLCANLSQRCLFYLFNLYDPLEHLFTAQVITLYLLAIYGRQLLFSRMRRSKLSMRKSLSSPSPCQNQLLMTWT